MSKAYLALGSNLGKRPQNLKKAIELLKECGVKILKSSKIHETKPVSRILQRKFLNQCLEVETKHNPQKLLKICQLIEGQMGRDRIVKKRKYHEKPRKIDIDILLYENLIINSKFLKIPHPRMHKRKFVLEPLNDIAPRLEHPTQHKTINYLLKNLKKPLNLGHE
ncbi:2-amino-4-hydroxy-6-hydroxymethyldihydropteridine diphosphokinase [Patescibacteria group bacterium]